MDFSLNHTKFWLVALSEDFASVTVFTGDVFKASLD